MNATVQHIASRFRSLPQRDLAFAGRSGPLATPAMGRADESHHWLVDLTALARCRALLAGHPAPASFSGTSQQSLMDVPAAYDLFCRTHFTSVKRLHPGLSWEDACPAYAIALSAHAVLCVALDIGREQQLEMHWPEIRGASRLSWSEGRPLIADGCKALARLDPIAMHR